MLQEGQFRKSNYNKEEELGTKSKCIKGPDIIYVGGWGGKIVRWARPIFFREKGWARREFGDDWGWVIVCFVKNPHSLQFMWKI